MPKLKTAIIVMGRGIGKNRATGKFEPTGMWEKVDLSSGRAAHTGIIEEADPDVEDVRYGGGILNDRAGATLFWETTKSLNPAEAIYLAAGYPPYLQKMVAETTEGVVHMEKIKEELQKLGGQIDDEKLVHTYPSNQDTFDDLGRSFQKAVQDGMKKVIVITVEVHLPRVKVMAEYIIKSSLGLDKIEIEFMASEDILKKNDKEFQAIYEEAKTKKAYVLTKIQEEKGAKEFLKGKYKLLPSLTRI